MGLKTRLALLIACCCIASRAYTINLDSLLYIAYDAEDEKTSQKHFSNVRSLLKNDSQIAYYHYFKYYHFNKVFQEDSIKFYRQIALKQLFDTRQWYWYFRIRNNYFWDLIDRSLYDEAIQQGQENIEQAIRYKDTVTLIGFYANMSIAYHDIEQFAKGIEYGHKGVLLGKNRTDAFNSTSDCINGIAICYDDWNKPDSAIKYHRINLGNRDKLEIRNVSQTLNNLGNTYLKIKQLDSAKKYIGLAVEADRQIDDHYKLATSMNNQGVIYMKLGESDRAETILDSALMYSRLSRSNEKLRDVYHTLYEFNTLQGRYKQALEYHEKHHTFKDSILSNERLRIINALEFKAKEAQLSEAVAKARNATRVRNFWIALISTLLVLAIFVIRQIYLKRKQLAKESLLRLQDERLRISRDLHDNLGAELTYISSVIDQKVYGIKDPEKRAELEVISTSSRHAMNQLRETIWTIKTDRITFRKFAVKLKDIGEKYANIGAIDFQVRTGGEDPLLKPAVVINLLRICQEAINNAVKYSQCSRLAVDINVENGKYTINIEDNGVGFSPEHAQKGNGIQNMRERAQEIGAVFSLNSKPGKGVNIVVKGNA